MADTPLALLPIPLLQWYEENARELPWRQDVTAYRIWISEIMLQQTRVTAVMGYFTRFLEAFPTVEALANAPEERLLKLWQGLGYYSRARNLQKAAQQIMERHNGQFPAEYEDIRALAGVGDYTAAAIASIAFGLPYPAVDGNLLRVAARVMGDDTDITAPAGKRHFSEAIAAVFPVKYPGMFNQAMMDLGATVCLPNGAPLCDRCPAAWFCEANRRGIQEKLPVRSAKKPRRIEERNVFFFFRNNRVALRQRPEKGLLAKLWEFPNDTDPHQLWGLTLLSPPRFAGVGKHIFTHIEWHMTAYTAQLAPDELPDGWVWATLNELKQVYSIPGAFNGFWDIVERELKQ